MGNLSRLDDWGKGGKKAAKGNACLLGDAFDGKSVQAGPLDLFYRCCPPPLNRVTPLPPEDVRPHESIHRIPILAAEIDHFVRGISRSDPTSISGSLIKE